MNLLASYKYPYTLTLLDHDTRYGVVSPTFTQRGRVIKPIVAISQKLLFDFSLVGVR